MATIAYTKEFPKATNDRVCIVTWPGMAASDTGAPFVLAQYADRSVQVAGTFDGATLALQGSNDGVNWAVLTDPQGNDLNITSSKIEMIAEVTLYVRPISTGGGASSSLTVTLLGK